MGLYSGSIAYTRYRLIDEVPDNTKEFVLNKLELFAFREIDAASLNEKSAGWVSAENMASTAFSNLHWVKEPYFVFALRTDVRKIPPLAMKAAMLREEIRVRKARGLERLTKQDRDDLREEVRQSLLKRVLPVPAVHEVCWNFSTNTVLLFATGTRARDDFTSFFYRCFELKLRPMVSYSKKAEDIPPLANQYSQAL